MNFEFAIKHWILTLLVAPVFNFLIMFSRGNSPVLEYFPLYLFWLVFSIALSFPAFLVYLASQWILQKYISNGAKMRTILSAIAIITLMVTNLVLFNGLENYDFLLSYSLAILITAIFIKVEPAPIEWDTG